jgi:ABC-type lipoprotein release transport system permease subunit
MNVSVQIALRNLVRQKRRNILLSIAIAFGMLILVLANSFSHGISDVLFNKIIVYVAGHVSVNFTQGGNLFRQVFRDGDRMLALVKRELPDAQMVDEAIGVMARAVGNGRSDNVILIGIDLAHKLSPSERADMRNNFPMVQGKLEDLLDSAVEHPTLLAREKAAYLNVHKGDVLRVRFRDLNGQDQAARLTVVGIFKPSNIFMQAPVFVELGNLKRLAGYGPHDVGNLYITLKDPRRTAVACANKLFAALNAPLAAACGSLACRAVRTPATALGMRSDSLSQRMLADSLPLVAGEAATAFGKKGIALAEPLAAVLGAKPGDTCWFSYRTKYGGDTARVRLIVTAIFRPAAGLGPSVALVNEHDLFDFYYERWPQPPPSGVAGCVVPPEHALRGALATEWVLLKRMKTSDDVQKQYREVAKMKWRATTVDVQSMYESASAVVDLEVALNLITLTAVMILFFIILVGVVNTLRMTIRERTREIGTIRAIGMQKSDVRNVFILETFFLALFACIAGTALAFGAMWGLAQFTIDAQDNPLGMLLVNGHLHFMPTWLGTFGYLGLILLIAVGTAYFPARRAANLSAAAALRHYE